MGQHRRRLAAIPSIAILVSACSAGASAPGASYGAPPPDTGATWQQPAASASGAPDWHTGGQWPPDEGWEPRPTAEPYPDVTYVDPGTNPFTDPREDHESTFAMDVDTASYDIAERYLLDGYLPDPASVRIEEYVNRFDLGYPVPVGQTFGVYVDGGPTPYTGSPLHRLIRIGIQARDVHELDRPPAALTFVIDVSGSMAQEGRLEIVKGSLELLVDELRPRDRVAIVVYGDDARVVLGPTPADERGRILDAIRSLHPEGSTNAEAGIRLGYRLAREALAEGAINRVVLASDGVANVGQTEAARLLEDIRRDKAAGIEMVSIGVGMGNYDDAFMEQMADDGDGFYAYIETRDDAERVFVEDLTGTLLTVAQEAKVQVDWDTELVEGYRLLGFENRAIADEDFRNDRVDAGEIGAGHSVTALYEVRLGRDVAFEPARLGEVHLRWREPETGRTEELATAIDSGALSGDWRESDPHFRLAATVAAFAEQLAGSPYADGASLHDVAEEASQLRRSFDGDPQVDEFARLVERASDLDW